MCAIWRFTAVAEETQHLRKKHSMQPLCVLGQHTRKGGESIFSFATAHTRTGRENAGETVQKKEREEKITNGQIPRNHRSYQQRILEMAPIRTGRTKAKSAKVPSCARKRASAEKKKRTPPQWYFRRNLCLWGASESCQRRCDPATAGGASRGRPRHRATSESEHLSQREVWKSKYDVGDSLMTFIQQVPAKRDLH